MNIGIIDIVISIIISLIIVFIDWNWGHILVERVVFWRRATILISDTDGIPIPSATVIVSGSGTRCSDEKGEAKFYIPRHDVYGIQVKYKGYEAGHYMLELRPGKRYQYSRDSGLIQVTQSPKNMRLTLNIMANCYLIEQKGLSLYLKTQLVCGEKVGGDRFSVGSVGFCMVGVFSGASAD